MQNPRVCRFPIPRDVEVIDLSLVFGVPRFGDALDAILNEGVIEGGIAAEEACGIEAGQWMSDRVDPLTYAWHDELKRQVRTAEFVVRTGETTSFANVILICGVPF